jgi:UDP-GlcNAc:undecaprenyl-phosphate/decaprenyl-phosphate GlcNAc-1-phosphate transferase
MPYLMAMLADASGFALGDVLAPYVYVFYTSFLVALVFTPLMRHVAVVYGIIDEPDGLRKMHSEPVAYLGGVAVFLGWIVGLATSQFLHMHRQDPGLPGHVVINTGIVAGAIVIVLLGLWDDLLGVSAWKKICGQVAAACFLLYQGIGVRCAETLLAPVGERLNVFMHLPRVQPVAAWCGQTFGWPVADAPLFSPWFVGLFSTLLVIFIVVGCCNAANLMDGLDGLCGGVTSIISASFLFVAMHLATTGTAQNSNMDAMRIVLALALLGGVLGFVPYNFNPASIFMGDAGSMFLGFCCAVMIILMGEGQQAKWFLASMVIFALPVLDTALAFARRYVNHRPLFSPDRKHLHHQLVARGFSVRQTVLINYGLAIFFGLMGVLIVYVRTRFAGAIYLMVFGFVIVAAYKMGMVHEKPLTNGATPVDGPDAKSAGESEKAAAKQGVQRG